MENITIAKKINSKKFLKTINPTNSKKTLTHHGQIKIERNNIKLNNILLIIR